MSKIHGIFILSAFLLTLACVNKASKNNETAQMDLKSTENVADSVSVKLQGNYKANVNDLGGEYALTFSFAESTYLKDLYFENDPVRKCTGKFTYKGDSLRLLNRSSTFVRSEEPGPTEEKGHISYFVKVANKDSIKLLLPQNSEEGFSEDKWICLKKE